MKHFFTVGLCYYKLDTYITSMFRSCLLSKYKRIILYYQCSFSSIFPVTKSNKCKPTKGVPSNKKTNLKLWWHSSAECVNLAPVGRDRNHRNSATARRTAEAFQLLFLRLMGPLVCVEAFTHTHAQNEFSFVRVVEFLCVCVTAYVQKAVPLSVVSHSCYLLAG